MAKYRDHGEFGVNAPMNWRENTTTEGYLWGMNKIAPEGMSPKRIRGERFGKNTDRPESARWHHNYDLAMFGGTEIPSPTYEDKQLRLEQDINGIERIPRTERR